MQTNAAVAEPMVEKMKKRNTLILKMSKFVFKKKMHVFFLKTLKIKHSNLGLRVQTS